ncbi:Ig-like domain-containing protein [Nocardioides abyssi]|uniref:Ig-like domain-containing protein n=1 Tax=Nocardioides abyssi TaxID=3058370 RepID=A0ABT8EWJ0_9ACTN|nr:Ig-like domain-containing protein [Nocardioides abyssi]MDN4162429.1 Ig-like domain-containing protein [Nocardioides abyssi]
MTPLSSIVTRTTPRTTERTTPRTAPHATSHSAVHTATTGRRTTGTTRTRRTGLLAGAALVLTTTLAGLGGVATAAAGGEWQDGKHDEDTVIDCITGGPSTGVSANVSWRSPSGKVPKVGEKFYLRGYIGLVSIPCSGKVAVLPEIMVPRGVEFVDEDVRWDLTKAGEDQDLGTGELAFDQGVNGGIVVGNADFTPFTLRQGDVLELQFPVKATRELKGPATQQPECQSRREGTAPCPIAQSGDHFQMAFTVGGHGSDKQYVTPYVGLFAGGDATVKMASHVTAKFSLSSRRKGSATVTVGADSPVAGGKVVITDNGRRIGAGKVDASGRARVALPRMKKGKHVLVAAFGGTSGVKASASKRYVITVR